MTARLFRQDKLLIASHNPGKVNEMGALLRPFGVEVVSAGELNLPEPEETGETFTENARLKALAAALASGLPALADDSGMAVVALGGNPGVRSARWAGPTRDFNAAMKAVEKAMTGFSDRRASFICVLALAWPDGHVECFEGEIEGALVWPPRGNQGFGYDPMFLPNGHSATFGEMSPAEKHKISHRAQAFAKLVRSCFQVRQ
ncbi:MAG TPA: RdgB/HAM1 family non-canonical purine NTP pyrophosphatase [Rhodospirillaceae bacterium]|nr:RdgB/HAM1 family non-canonical purine NTP pyrophosphatase [Rhodospirillaceae bacterium]